MRHNTDCALIRRRRTAFLWATLLVLSLSAPAAAPAAPVKGKKGQAVEEKKEAEKPPGESEEKAAKEPAGKTPAEAETREGDSDEGVLSKEFTDEDFEPRLEEESAVWMFLKMIIILGLFGAGFYYFYRFVSRKTGVGIFGGDAIRVLSAVPLGQNKYLQVVDLAGKVLVIGVSDNAINLISEITDKDQIDRIRIMSTRTPPPGAAGGGFQEHIMRQFGKFVERVQGARRKGRGPMESSGAPADIDYLRSQRSRLKNLNGYDDE
ncbi:MAG: flagellar biosynthetic protein FliO [Spirochaetes bacterium]|nr:flagellar biosynthetic protein FliO [Spirochaetota bacterium]